MGKKTSRDTNHRNKMDIGRLLNNPRKKNEGCAHSQSLKDVLASTMDYNKVENI